MRRPRPLYTLGRALKNLRGAPLPAVAAAATMAVALFLIGVFLLAGENFRRALVGWAGEADHMTVFAARGMSGGDATALERRIEATPGVERVRTIPPEEGLRDLRRSLGDAAAVLDGVIPADVLPTAFSVALETGALDRESSERLAAELRAIAGVESVESESLWLERFERLVRVARWTAIGWGAILLGGSLLVIGNTARLAALTRKEEIEVLRLVGASDGFVLAPFFVEGAVQGVVGSLAALGALYGAFSALGELVAADRELSGFFPGGVRFLDSRTLVALLLAGPVLGAVGAAGSARRFLRKVAL